MRSADDQDDDAAGVQQLAHPGEGSCRVGHMLQRMGGGDDVVPLGQRHGVEIARNQPGLAHAKPGLGGAQHRRRPVEERQRHAVAKVVAQRLGKGTVTGTKIQRCQPTGAGRQPLQRVADHRAIGGGKAKPGQVPTPARGGGLIAGGRVRQCARAWGNRVRHVAFAKCTHCEVRSPSSDWQRRFGPVG